MKFRLTLTTLAAALSLAGCVTSRGLHTEGVPLDAASLHGEQTFAGPLSPANWPRADWWSSLGDPHLDALIREALAASPDLQVAAARTRQADADVIAANAARQPQVDAGAAVTRSRLARVDDPSGLGERYGTVRSLSLNASYDVDLWGGQRAAWEAAVGRAQASEIDQQQARLILSTAVARAYNDLGLAYADQDIAAQDLQRTRDMLDLSRQRVRAGIDSDFQMQQTESLEAAAEAALTAARQQLRSAQIRLAVLLGKGPDRGGELPRPALIAPPAVSVPAQLPAELVGRRPDLVAARWRVEAATRDIAAARSEFYPNLNLSLGAGVKSMLGDALFGGPSRFFDVGPALSLPIFDGGWRRSDLAGANAGYDLAVAQYNQTLVNALGDAADAVTQVRSLDQQIAEQQRARDIARSSYELALSRYREGIGSYLDALSVEQQLLQTDRQLASLNAARIDNAVLLMQALGGGYQPSTTPPPVAAALHDPQ